MHFGDLNVFNVVRNEITAGFDKTEDHPGTARLAENVDTHHESFS